MKEFYGEAENRSNQGILPSDIERRTHCPGGELRLSGKSKRSKCAFIPGGGGVTRQVGDDLP